MSDIPECQQEVIEAAIAYFNSRSEMDDLGEMSTRRFDRVANKQKLFDDVLTAESELFQTVRRYQRTIGRVNTQPRGEKST